jgi:hypothetical protein
MTLLHEAVEAKKYDSRVIERNVARGAISAEEVQKITKGLPDDTEAGQWVSIQSIAGDESTDNQD